MFFLLENFLILRFFMFENIDFVLKLFFVLEKKNWCVGVDFFCLGFGNRRLFI